MGKGVLCTVATGCVLVAAAVGCGHQNASNAQSANEAAVEPRTPSSSPSAATSVPPSRILNEQQLEHAAITRSDLPGFQVSSIVGDGSALQPTVRAQRAPSPAQCAPLNDMTQYLGRFQPVWQVVKGVDGAGKDSLPGTTVALASYRGQDAVTLMTEVHTALAHCTQFTPPQPNEGWTYSHIQQMPAPSAGDDAISYRMTQNMPADNVSSALSVVFSYVVVRTGTTVTTFASNYFGANNKPAKVPQKIIDAQLKKLT